MTTGESVDQICRLCIHLVGKDNYQASAWAYGSHYQECYDFRHTVYQCSSQWICFLLVTTMTGFLPRTAEGLQSNLLCLWKPLKSVAIFCWVSFSCHYDKLLRTGHTMFDVNVQQRLIFTQICKYQMRDSKIKCTFTLWWICLWQTENVNEWQMKFIQHWRKRVEKIAPPHIAALELIWNWIMIFCESDGFKSCCTIFVTLRIPLLAKQSYTTAIQNN